MLKTQTDWREQMQVITKELAKLEQLDWTKDDKVAERVFPYVLREAINLLLNAKPKDEKFLRDHMSTSEMASKVLSALTE